MNTTISNTPVISDSEFAQRLSKAQALIRKNELDILLVNSNEADFANVRYVSDFWTLFEIAGVAISPSGPAAVLVGPESGQYARDRTKIPLVHTMLEYRESADPAYPGVPVSTFEKVFAEIGVPSPKRIGVGGYLVTTNPVMEGLRRAFPKAEIVRADQIMVELRSIKSEAEIACQKRAFEICEIATAAVIDRIKPGMTEQQVVGIAQEIFYREGGEYEGHPTYVLSGKNSSHAISRPTSKKLVRGEIIQLNIGARVSGYASSVGLPICLGPMSKEAKKLVEFGLDAHAKTIDWLKPGVLACDIANKYRQLFRDHGFDKNYLYGPCHGLGMVEVEPPWMEEISNYPLVPNMTFQVDTFVTGPDFGLRLENGGRVTPTGFEMYSGKFRKVVEVV